MAHQDIAAGAPLIWKIEGMDCASCAAKIRGALERLPGVDHVGVSVMAETLTLTLDETLTPRETVEKRLASLGYAASPLAARSAERPLAAEGGHDHAHQAHAHAGHGHRGSGGLARGHGHVHEAVPPGTRWYRTAQGRLVIGTGLLVGGAWLASHLWAGGSHWLFIGACLIGLAPVARRAFAAAWAGMPFTIEMLMTIAAVGALFIGAAEEAALVVFLFAVGEALEGVAADRARASIRSLADLVPKTALIEEEGAIRQVDAALLEIGQTVLVRPGDRIPADGDILSGLSGIDESPVTGESVPKSKGAGDAVFAGSINHEAALRIRVTRAAEDNTIARIIRLVEEAQEARAPTERFIDRFARVYMPAIVALALVTALAPPLLFGADWMVWIYRALALLLIGCPCALVISVPAAIAAALSAGARQGLLMKGGVAIEAAARTGIVAFDKTGTLTEGRPRVTDVAAFEGWSEDAVLDHAAAVETGSSHPLAQAILERAKSLPVPLRPAAGVTVLPGQGVAGTREGREIFVGAPRHAARRATFTEAMLQTARAMEGAGKTVAAVLVDGQPAGLIALRDEARADAARAVRELKGLGLRSIMLTGDNARTGAAIAGALDMEHEAELMPQDKVAAIRRLAGERPVMMVGDGVNDAPALAAADIGIAMGSGTDVALETADGAILKSRLRDVPAMIALARATMANIHANIAIALGLKAIFLVTSLAGYTGLWLAILADTGATVIVTANALRLLRFRAD